MRCRSMQRISACPSFHRETVPHEKVHVAMLPAGDARIELLEPVDESSTIAKFLSKSADPACTTWR